MKTIKSKEQITNALYELIYERPYESISVKEICDRAKVSRMSFYRYYYTKDDVLVAYADQRFEEFVSELEKIDVPNMASAITLMFDFVYRYKKQLSVLVKIERFELFEDRFKSYSSYVSNKFYGSVFKGDIVKNKLLLPFIEGGCFYIIKYWTANNFKESPEEITKLTLQIFNVHTVEKL